MTRAHRHLGRPIVALALAACSQAADPAKQEDAPLPTAGVVEPPPQTPPPACVPGPREPMKLMIEDPTLGSPVGVIPDGPSLVVRTHAFGAPAGDVSDAIVRVPTAGGVPELVETPGYIGGDFVHFRGRDVYLGGRVEKTGTQTRYVRSQVFVREPVSGATTQLPDVRPPALSVSDLVADPTGVYWQTQSEGSGSMIARWSADTGEVAAIARDTASFAVDSGEVFYFKDADSKRRMEAVPVEGGPPRLVSPGRGSGGTILGVDTESVYVAYGQDHETDLYIVQKDGAGERRHPHGLRGPIWDAFAQDGEFVYTTEPGGELLVRVPKAGGKTEVLADHPGRSIAAIAVDACNVYWVTYGPSEVFVRAR